MPLYYVAGFGALNLIAVIMQSKSVKGFLDQLPLLIAIIAVIGVITSLIATTNSLFIRDAVREKITVIEGVVSVRSGWYSSPGGQVPYYNIVIARKTFRFTSEKTVKGFVNDSRYRLYFIRFAPLDIVLSGEYLG